VTVESTSIRAILAGGAALPAGPLSLDGSGVKRLAERSTRALALIEGLRLRSLWPPIVASVVLPDCLSGDVPADEAVERFLRCCDVREEVPVAVARRAAWLRTAAGRGSAADAVVVALAEPGGAILTSGRRDTLEALALFAEGVMVERA
jgi:hypothetical protein